MTERAKVLEGRVRELEMECKWLRSLITEKDPEVLSSVACPCHHPTGLVNEQQRVNPTDLGKRLQSEALVDDDSSSLANKRFRP